MRVVGGTNYATNSWTYDARRRVTFETDPAGTITAWQYCDCDGASQITRGYGLGLAETTTNTYDNLGRWVQQRNAFGVVESRTYRFDDQVLTSTDRNGVTTTNAYDALGRIETRTLNSGVPERWFYSANFRGPTSYTNQIGKETQWTYDAAGRKTNEVVVGVMTNRFVYNGAGDLTDLYDGNQVGGANRTQWRYDAYGRVTAKVYANNQTNLTYAYDSARRLTGVTSPAGTFGYQFTGPGTLVARLDQPGGFWVTNTFDSRGRLTDTTLYDNTEVRYVYDGMLIVQERSSGNHPQVTYTRGTDLSGTLERAGGIGGLLSRGAHAISSPYQLSSAAHYHADGNGNVTMLVGTGAPTIKAYYKYDPFGRTLGSSGSLVGVNAMRFSSKPVMGSSELYYYGYRFYDPSSQRWLNRDPIGEEGEAEHILLSGQCSIERSRSSWFECVYS